MRCGTCNSQRTGTSCWKCGSELAPDVEGMEYPKLPPIDRIRELARDVGYAIGEHGSKERDLDLIAVPWTAGAVDSLSLVCHIALGLKSVNGKKAMVIDGGETRPHGRIGYNIQMDGYYKIIDISVMPLYAAPVLSLPPVMCGCGDTFGDGSVCANCLAGIDCKPVPDEVPAAMKRDQDTWGDATMAVLGQLERAINIIVDNSHCHMTPHMVCIPEDKWIAAMQLCGGVMPSATATEERKDET